MPFIKDLKAAAKFIRDTWNPKRPEGDEWLRFREALTQETVNEGWSQEVCIRLQEEFGKEGTIIFQKYWLPEYRAWRRTQNTAEIDAYIRLRKQLTR